MAVPAPPTGEAVSVSLPPEHKLVTEALNVTDGCVFIVTVDEAAFAELQPAPL